MNYEDLKLAPDKTGWYIILMNTNLKYVGYYGPYMEKATAVADLKDQLRFMEPPTRIEYRVERYIVSITLDTHVGNWIPKLEDFKS